MMELNESIEIQTTEMHTGGEPLRIVESGYPEIKGETILEKRRYAKTHLDHFRKFLMMEPRGHFDMYGALLVKPDIPADLGVLFTHNEGYSTMCGHAVLALGRYAVDKGIVDSPTSPETTVTIQCPCGPVKCYVEYDGVKTGRVRFHSVPAFAFALDQEVNVEGVGNIKVDIGYGGAFYAFVPDKTFGLNVRKSSTNSIIDAATRVSRLEPQAKVMVVPVINEVRTPAKLHLTAWSETEVSWREWSHSCLSLGKGLQNRLKIPSGDAVKMSIKLHHPDSEDLAFLYGTIITDGQDQFSDKATANVCVFADRQVDRCPTGSGVTARIALQHAKGLIQINQCRTFESGANGSLFTGKPIDRVMCGDYDAVIVEVSGAAHYSGKATFTVEGNDLLKYGFLLK